MTIMDCMLIARFDAGPRWRPQCRGVQGPLQSCGVVLILVFRGAGQLAMSWA